MQTVYIETTIPSYLTARPSTMPLMAAHQEMTRNWWVEVRPQFEVFISTYILNEAAAGDPDAASRRLAALSGIPVLAAPPDTTALSAKICELLRLPPKATADATHLALAILHKMDYLLTWNCAHIANSLLQRRLIEFCQDRGLHTPVICTPEHLTGAD